MQNKKTATKKEPKKPVVHKMDRKLISKQKWEIEYVRLIFYKMVKGAIIHPSAILLKTLVTELNNSRKDVYNTLKQARWIQLTIK